MASRVAWLTARPSRRTCPMMPHTGLDDDTHSASLRPCDQTWQLSMRIGYLASHYPAVSHRFLLREIQALRRCGVEVETFSIHRTPASELLTQADREEGRRTYAVWPPRMFGLLRSHLSAVLRAPARYINTLVFALRRANPGVRGRLAGLFYFAESMAIWDAARRRGVRHIHASFADSASDAALLATRFGGELWTWSLAIHGPVEFEDLRLNRLAEKVNSARFTVAISDFGRSQLMTLAAEGRWKDIHVVHCGIDPAECAAEPTPRSSGEPEILCVGRLVQRKGQSLLIEAVAALLERGVPVRLTLVGDGPTRPDLEALAHRIGVGNRVRFAGAVGHDEILPMFRSADIFCLPSFSEGVPVVLMEAMAHSVPVVTTQVMGIPELVENGHSGLLVAPGRVDVLVDALAQLIADPELRTRLGGRGRDKVLSDFDVNVSARHLQSVLFAMLDGLSRTI
jgi:colanic acid/amylovoran biosynthesis glycosyltransferase